jgi:hypothetical protein
VLEHKVGVRPGRSKVRLELELIKDNLLFIITGMVRLGIRWREGARKMLRTLLDRCHQIFDFMLMAFIGVRVWGDHKGSPLQIKIGR